ncbi:class I SAM-dependent methyltransferase [Lichenifustis flavocetrariae]|uniref:Nodulation S family protein n=1 Tax=Lichenifustis flavocetrariae TaxID=2949735 RepID=A0AA42CJC1_9HYPH|nr:class I SAM-dependent methyltransferase [Lichenifustis flavocetrariae]MCW6509423.1 nodulation S family protein [Lichenifustis flavocetrariae]
MTRRETTIEATYFDTLYTVERDPWGFRTSDYERGKYAATLGALSKARYSRALEVGCSIGVFTEQLAARCDTLVAIDASEVALAAAREACAGCENVIFEARMVPKDFPPGSFDLIVLSEVIYYLDALDLHKLAAQCARALLPGGEIVTCHWLGETDYPLTGAVASDLFALAMAKRLPVHAILHDRDYRLDRLSSS